MANRANTTTDANTKTEEEIIVVKKADTVMEAEKVEDIAMVDMVDTGRKN